MPEPTKHFNFVQVTLGGSTIETVMPAAGKPVGTIAFDLTALAFYQVCQTAANAHVWRSLGGSAAGWSKYVVSNQTTPLAPYATVTSAIAAAVADGHDQTHLATILVMPGTYVEDVTCVGGIAIQGLGGLAGQAGPTIQGTVTVGLDVGQSVTLRDLTIVGQLHLTSTKAQGVELVNVTVTTTSGTALLDDNSDVTSALDAFNCTFFTSDAAGNAYHATSPRNGTFRECRLAAPSTGTGISVAGGGPRFERCDVDGAVNAATSGTATLLASRVRATGGANPAINVGAGATVEATQCVVDSGATKAVAGAGTYRGAANTYPNGDAVDVSITGNAIAAPQSLVFGDASTSGPFPQGVDVLLVDCSGGDVTITLPNVAAVLAGRVLQVKSTTNDGVHKVTLAAAAGETLDGAATFDCALARGWCAVATKHNVTDWHILNAK